MTYSVSGISPVAGALELLRSGAPAVRPIGPFTVSGQVVTGAGILAGWCIRNVAGTGPSVGRLWDGAGTNGQLVAGVSINQGDSDIMPPSLPGIYIQSGVYLEELSGQVEAVLWWIPAGA